jgi:gas vesicle protein
MELFEPQNFFQMANLLAGILTGVVAIAGLLIALATYKVAREALTTWKEQKNHEYEVIIHSNIKELINILSETYSIDKSYSSIFVLHSSNFKYNSADYRNIEKQNPTLDSALIFIRMVDITKDVNKPEINSLISLINPAVIGLKNPIVSSIFYDIKDFIENINRVENQLIKWTGYFKDTTAIKGKINHLNFFEFQFKEYFQYKLWEKELISLEYKVDNYLRGKI